MMRCSLLRTSKKGLIWNYQVYYEGGQWHALSFPPLSNRRGGRNTMNQSFRAQALTSKTHQEHKQVATKNKNSVSK
jgi:hypothetical protein